jgi:hypothetical protein
MEGCTVIKRDEIANPNSCLNRAADDEPIFVLRANDELAAQMVRQWAELYFDTKKDDKFNITDAQRAKYREARALSNEMESWHRNHFRLAP